MRKVFRQKNGIPASGSSPMA
jgi:serine/threonine protein kinase